MQATIESVAVEVGKSVGVVGLLLAGLRYAIRKADDRENKVEELYKRLMTIQAETITAHLKVAESNEKVAETLSATTAALQRLEQTMAARHHNN